MPDITVSIDEEARRILQKRADKNFFTLREQIEDIIRKSAIRTKNAKKVQSIKADDKLIAIFSRDKRGRTKKQKKEKKGKKNKK